MRKAQLLVLVPTLCCAQAPAAKPVITIPEAHHDFGKINHDEKVNFTFTVKNAGDADLQISGLHPSCGCTFGALRKDLLKPGETTDVEVTFDPNDFRGHVSKYLQVTSNDPSTPVASLSFEADISRDIVPSTGTVSFHDLRRTSAEKTLLRLQSDNGKPVQVTGMKIEAPFISTHLSQDGQDALVEVVFEARKMSVYQSSGRKELIIGTTNPHFLQIPIFVEWDFKPSIAASPVRVAWVNKADHPHRGPVVLSSIGGKPFRILQVKPSREDIVVEGVGPQAATSHSLNVLFNSKRAGAYDETITFVLDDPDQPEFKLGVAAVLE